MTKEQSTGEIAARNSLTLRVAKRTGTPGDTLIAWGLALVASAVSRRDVLLSDAPDAFEITVRLARDELPAACAAYHPTAQVMLPWLACATAGRTPGVGIGYAVERDELRADYQRLRELGQRPAPGGDAPAVAAHRLAPKYPLFRTLTTPRGQWDGYNSFVERAAVLWSPAGVEGLLRVFAADAEVPMDADLDRLARQLSITRRQDRRRNPPGFLFPGQNKGPTMRLGCGGLVIGDAKAPDWVMVDRDDLSLIDLYLAYVGYFAVGTVLDDDKGRIVAVPMPARIMVRSMVQELESMRPLTYIEDRAAREAGAELGFAEAKLRFAKAALAYLAGLADVNPIEAGAGRAPTLVGIHAAVFWKPQGTIYAVDHVTFVPLPSWLRPLVKSEGVAGAREVIRDHHQQIRSLEAREGATPRQASRRRRPARSLCPLVGEEARAALDAYQAALTGDLPAWLRVPPAWHRAVLAEDQRIEPSFVRSWLIDDSRRIVMAMQPELETILNDPAFESITAAIRRATIYAHYDRTRRQAGSDAVASDRPGSPLSPQYDLVGSLQEAASRHPDEFLRELCGFVAEYNNEAMRRKQPMVRVEDLEQVIAWTRGDRRGLVPALLIAFGVSPHRRQEQRADAPDNAGTAAHVGDQAGAGV
ncbi:MAG: hypothetical protein IT340_17240 [Chloroflexi bacterium]|nr:hypothetical protein [Chloroflexota bacterium]